MVRTPPQKVKQEAMMEKRVERGRVGEGEGGGEGEWGRERVRKRRSGEEGEWGRGRVMNCWDGRVQ